MESSLHLFSGGDKHSTFMRYEAQTQTWKRFFFFFFYYVHFNAFLHDSGVIKIPNKPCPKRELRI